RALAGFAGPAQPVILPSNFHQTWADGIVVILGGTPTSALSVLPGTIEALLLIFFAWGICLFAPNSVEIMGRYRPVLDSTNFLRQGLKPKLPGVRIAGRLLAAPGVGWGLILALLLGLTLLRVLSNA